MPVRRHTVLSTKIRDWMIALSDPVAPRRGPPEKLLAEDIARLVEAASLHAVRPAVFRNLGAAIDSRNATHVVADSDAEAALSKALVVEKERRSAQTKLENSLNEQGARISKALSENGVRSVRAKGDVFAKHLYPHPLDRPFGDIDILVPVEDLDKSKPVLVGLGFRLDSSKAKGGQAYRIDKWISEREKAVEVEIQANLIHSQKIGSSVSLSYDEILIAGGGNPEDATALLLVGAIHGSAVHQFDRLQHIIDVLQAVRGAAGEIDADRLKHTASMTGATVALQTALDITGAMFDEPRSIALANHLSPAPLREIRRRLLTEAAVMRARSTAKWRDSWRRRLLQAMIKSHGKRERHRVRAASG